jgi:hypothetical protein
VPLRDQLLDVCGATGADVNAVVQALVDCLMISLIAVGPDADAAEKNIRNVAADMLANVDRAYREYHAMAEAQRGRRQ